MNKLHKVVFCILFLIGLGYKGSCQVRVHMRYGQPMPPPRVMPMYRTYPQPNPGTRIELVKENFIRRQLNLTTQEARAFFPLYRQYQQQLMAVRIKIRLNSTEATANGTEQIQRELSYQQELVDIRKHYRDAFLRILTPEKVSQVYKSEREFNDELIRTLNERNIRPGD